MFKDQLHNVMRMLSPQGCVVATRAGLIAAVLPFLAAQTASAQDIIAEPFNNVEADGEWTAAIAPAGFQEWTFTLTEPRSQAITINIMQPAGASLDLSIGGEVLDTVSDEGTVGVELDHGEHTLTIANPGASAVLYDLSFSVSARDVFTKVVNNVEADGAWTAGVVAGGQQEWTFTLTEPRNQAIILRAIAAIAEDAPPSEGSVDVFVDGQALTVVTLEGSVAVNLAAGAHTVTIGNPGASAVRYDLCLEPVITAAFNDVDHHHEYWIAEVAAGGQQEWTFTTTQDATQGVIIKNVQPAATALDVSLDGVALDGATEEGGAAPDLLAGVHTLTISNPGASAVQYDLELSASLSISMSPSSRFVGPGGGTVSFRVTMTNPQILFNACATYTGRLGDPTLSHSFSGFPFPYLFQSSNCVSILAIPQAVTLNVDVPAGGPRTFRFKVTANGTRCDCIFCVCPKPQTAVSVNGTITRLPAVSIPTTTRNDTAETLEGNAINIPVLSNDTAPATGLLQVTGFTQGASGGVSFGPSGTLTYTPNVGFFGVDSFTYTIEVPQTCEDISVANPAIVGSGDFVIYPANLGGQGFGVHCTNMGTFCFPDFLAFLFCPSGPFPCCFDLGPAREYLTLVNVNQNRNYAEYSPVTLDQLIVGSTPVRTNYHRLRLVQDLFQFFLVDIGDQAHARSFGRVIHSTVGNLLDASFFTVVTSMPYGVAVNCFIVVNSTANVDLTGTPFIVNDFWEFEGAGGGAISVDGGPTQVSNLFTQPVLAEGQVVDIAGAGGCGGIGPLGPTIEILLNDKGGFRPTLVFQSDSVHSAPPPTATVTVTVTPLNRDPVCDAGGPYAVECDGLTLQASASDPDGDPVTLQWTSNCGATFSPNASVLNPTVSLGSSCNQSCTLTLTVDDGNGGTCSSLGNVSVNNTTPPSIACPANAVLECPADTSVAANGSATGFDTCGSVTITSSDSSVPGCGFTETITRTWTATDACGNSASCDQIITVQDTTLPVLSGVPGDVTVECDAVPTPASPTAEDNCPPTSCQDIRDADPAAVDGDYVISPNGNGFTVFCFDMAGTPREYLTLQNTGGSFNFAQFTAGGAVGGTTVRTNYTKVRLDPTTLLVNIGDQTFATSTGSACCIGPTTITSMPYGVAADCRASFSQAGQANIDLTGTPFLVNDSFRISGFNAAGSVNGVPGQVVNLTGGGFCGGTHPLPPGNFAPVNTGGGFNLNLAFIGPTLPSIVFAEVRTDGVCPDSYTLTRTWTATDACGNSSSATQTITVQDTTPPQITLNGGANILLECDFNHVYIDAGATASDNCDADVAVTVDSSAVNPALVGTYTVTFTATDDCENTATATRTVEVVDTIGPEFTSLPADLTVECEGSDGVAITNPDVQTFLAVAVASDQCDPLVGVSNDAPAVFPFGPTIVTWSAQDLAGNPVTASRTVTVVDTTPPDVTCPAGTTVLADADCQAPIPDVTGAVAASDLCMAPGALVITQSPSPGTLVTLGTTFITVTVTDPSGNSNECMTSLSVVDETPPAVTCPAPTTASADENCQAPIPDVIGGVVASDNCTDTALLSLVQSPAAGTVVTLGDHTITVTVTDEAGNAKTCSTTFSVIDTTPPSVVCLVDTFVPVDDDCLAPVPDVTDDATASDNCTSDANLTITQNPTAGTLFGPGDHTITVTVTDQTSNVSTCTTTLMVRDVTPPVLTVDTTPITVVDVDCSGDEPVALPTATATDNCDPAPLVTNDAPATFPAGQTTTVTYTAEDVDGNSSTATVDVTVLYGADIFVQAAKHTVGGGSHPGSTKEPLVGITICAYDKSAGSCARVTCGGISHQHYQCIVDSCDPVNCAVTDENGEAVINLPPGDYVIISDDATKTVLPDPLGVSASDLVCGELKRKHLQQIVKADGKKLPGKTTRRTGSELLIIEPEFVVWDGTEQLYPFIFETLGDWGVTASVAPPEGFVADFDELSAEVTTEIEAVQFTITEVGSDLVPTQTRFDVTHRGRREIIHSSVGIFLTPAYARSRGFDVATLRARGLIVDPPGRGRGPNGAP